ncbi:MAG: hypothetical protein WAT12_13685 [Candidatus Nitrotoga sp.]
MMVMYRYHLSGLDLGHVRNVVANTLKATPLLAETEDAVMPTKITGSHAAM